MPVFDFLASQEPCTCPGCSSTCPSYPIVICAGLTITTDYSSIETNYFTVFPRAVGFQYFVCLFIRLSYLSKSKYSLSVQVSYVCVHILNAALQVASLYHGSCLSDEPQASNSKAGECHGITRRVSPPSRETLNNRRTHNFPRFEKTGSYSLPWPQTQRQGWTRPQQGNSLSTTLRLRLNSPRKTLNVFPRPCLCPSCTRCLRSGTRGSVKRSWAAVELVLKANMSISGRMPRR